MNTVLRRRRFLILLLGGLLLVLGAVAAGIVPVSREVLRTTAPHTPLDVERFGGPRILGQSFIAPEDRLSEIQLFLRPPVSPDAFPMLFHLRHGRYTSLDVRTVVVTATDVTADGVLRIRFAPVTKSGGQTYAFLLEAPRAQPKQLAAYRQIDSSIYERGFLFFGDTAELRAGDVEFAAAVREPGALAFWNARFRPLLEQSFGGHLLPRAVGIGSLATAAALALLSRLRPGRTLGKALGVLMTVHILLHAPFLLPYPGVNDEGSYLMDIQNIRAGYWPFRDTLAKGPLFLLVLAPVALFLPHNLLSARLLVAGLSGIEVLLLYLLGRRLGGQTVGLLAALLWTFSPITMAQTSQLFLQPFSLPLVTLALLLLLPARSAGEESGEKRSRLLTETRSVLLAGALFGLAYLVRASSLAFLAPAFFLCLLGRESRPSIRNALLLLMGFGGTLLLVALPAFFLLGAERTAVLFNIEAFVIGQARGGAEGSAVPLHVLPPSEILERFAAYGAVLFRLGTPLVLLWLAYLSRTLTALFRLPSAFGGIVFLGLSLPLLERVYAMNFTLASGFADVGSALKILVTMLTALISVVLWWIPRPPSPPARQSARELLLVGGTWLSLIIVYTFFGRFREQYHAEFLPFYVLGSALFLAPLLPQSVREKSRTFFSRQLWYSAVGIVLFLLLASSLFLSVTPSRKQPHTGSIPHRTALEVARILKKESAPGEEILTAQGLFTFYADRFLPFGASHPGWYLEERVGTVPSALRRLFLPDKEVLRRYVEEKPIRLVAIDRRTREVYFQYDPEMRALLQRAFRLLTTVPNPYEEDPVEIWIRK